MSKCYSSIKQCILCCILLVLSSCVKKTDSDINRLSGFSPNKIYWLAHKELKDAKYNKAIQIYSMLRSSYPQSEEAKQAIIDMGYIYYKQENLEGAIEQCEFFLKMYPHAKAVDYILYLKGLAYFYANYNFLSSLINLDVSKHDQETAIQSFRTFEKLVKGYPQSEYKNKASTYMVYLLDMLSRSELHIVMYYMKQSAFVAAINRAWYMIYMYPQSQYTEQALALIIYGYDHLKLDY